MPLANKASQPVDQPARLCVLLRMPTPPLNPNPRQHTNKQQVGRPLTWEESLEREHLQYVREHGVLQFLSTYDALKTMVKPELKWGEEMEFGIFKVCICVCIVGSAVSLVPDPSHPPHASIPFPL